MSSLSSSSSAHSEDEHGLTPQRQSDPEEDSTSGTSSSDINDQSEEPSDDAPVLSHAEQRKQKKKQPPQDDPTTKKKQTAANVADLSPSKSSKRQNSVWIGNLSFKTTPDALRRFFDGVGEITRIHMPTKLASIGPGGAGTRKENRGFAYVDFATADAKVLAITLSENPLDGRRLLIKDGDDFNGRPAASGAEDAPEGSSASTSKLAGHTKTAQKILRAQKQPAGPTLFLGNLGFEATEQSIRAMFDAHRTHAPAPAGAGAGADERTEGPDLWIRKVRLGTFEDSGKCKGWAFVDFASIEHATGALTNPKNSFLDGRKLVVEYASPDAVRRGGGLARVGDKKAKDTKEGTEEQRSRNRPAHDADRPLKRKSRAEGADVPDGDQAQDSSPKRLRVEDHSRTFSTKGSRGGKPPRARPRPGAALALAKRETAAIVPSQGQKIVF